MTSSHHLLRIQKSPMQSGTGDCDMRWILGRKRRDRGDASFLRGNLRGHVLVSFKGSFTFSQTDTAVCPEPKREIRDLLTRPYTAVPARVPVSGRRESHPRQNSRPSRLQQRGARGSLHGAVTASYGRGLLSTLVGLRCT